MSLDQKLQLVERNRQAWGLNACLRALGISKGTWHYRQHRRGQARKDAPLKEKVVEVIQAHPGYGYRRILEELRRVYREVVNHKRLRRILSQHDLTLRRTLPVAGPYPVHKALLAAGSARDLVKGRSFEALEAFSTDFTELIYAGGTKKAHLMVLLCVSSRWAGGWAVGPTRDRALALEALGRLKQQLHELGRHLGGVVIHHDQDSVYTSYDWLRRLLIEEGALVSFAENGAKDNPWIESFWGRFKVENEQALLEAQTFEEVVQVVKERLGYYNGSRRHSALAYERPEEVLSRIINPEKDRQVQ